MLVFYWESSLIWFSNFTGVLGNIVTPELSYLRFGVFFGLQEKGLQGIHVVGDSRVVIDWISGCSKLNVFLLSYWKSIILNLKNSFPSICFSHIYREFNTEAYEPLKKSLGPLEDFIFYEEILDGELLDRGKLFILEEE